MASESTRSETPPQLGISAAGGKLCLVRGKVCLAEATVAFDSVGGLARWRTGEWTEEGGGRFSSAVDGMVVQAWAEPAATGTTIHISIANQGSGPRSLARAALRIGGFTLRGEPSGASGLRMAYCGAHSRSPHSRSGATALTAGKPERGWWVGAIASHGSGPSVVVGALDFGRFVTTTEMEPGEIAAIQELENLILESHQSVEAAPVWVGIDSQPPFGLLEAYAGELGRRHNVRVRPSPCGWGTWGHYLESIDADLMTENLIALDASHPLRGVIRVVQIDDGWSELLDSQRASASWRPNRRFPSGIAPVAREVRARGRECGLWILPFTVNEGSPLAETHADYLVRDSDGSAKHVGNGRSFCLDPTQPGARAWLVDLFSRITDWGVTYVKLDFLRGLLSPDPDIPADDLTSRRLFHGVRTRVEAYRRGLEVVRSAVGKEVFLVGCSAPTGPGVGLVDAHRVGPDIEPAWIGVNSGIRDAVRSLAANWFWQGRAWVNDPDYLLATGSVAESTFWVTAVALSGGSTIISADLGEVAAWQERLFAMVTPPTGHSARPLDLFSNGPEPRLWHLPLEREGMTWHVVGLFNWDEHPAEMWLEPSVLGVSGKAHVWDVWRERHRIIDGRSPFFVEGHSAGLLGIRPVADRPQFVGTDIHFAQGLGVIESERWDSVNHRLTLEISADLPRAGHVHVWVPDGWKPRGSPFPRNDSLVSIEVGPGTSVTLEFDP